MDDKLNLACERATADFETELLADNPFHRLQIIVRGGQLVEVYSKGFRAGWSAGVEAEKWPGQMFFSRDGYQWVEGEATPPAPPVSGVE